jgi:hypothetical protein
MKLGERMSSKSDRLKKLEAELTDLEQWLKLGLVPKKEIPKHQREIESVREKIQEEKERLQFLKESGDGEEFTAPRRPTGRTQYTEGATLPDIDIGDEPTLTEVGGNGESDTLFGSASSSTYDKSDEEVEEEEEDEEDPFSDRNRWRRGMLHSDEDEW